MNFANILIVFGILLIISGIIFNFLPKGTLPKLPGDILIQKDGFTIFLPIVTSVLLSIILTIIFNLLNK